MKLCATTVTLPEHDVAETCELLKRFGFDGAEWRVRHNPPEADAPFSFWGRHKSGLSPENFSARAEELKAAAEEFGIEIAGIASNATADQLDEVRLLAEGASACGAPFIKVNPPRGYDRSAGYNALFDEAMGAYEKALEVTREYGVRVAVETHNRTIVVSASLAHRLFSNFSADDVGVIFDLNNMVRDGFETPRLAMELLGDYLVHVHLSGHRPLPGKERGDGWTQWTWEVCDVQDGLLDCRAIFEDLKAVGYEGWVSLEDFRKLPVEEKFPRNVEYLRKLAGEVGL